MRSAAAESLLLKNGGDPVKAFEEGLTLFNSSSIYVTAMAAHHKNTSAVSTVSTAIMPTYSINKPDSCPNAKKMSLFAPCLHSVVFKTFTADLQAALLQGALPAESFPGTVQKPAALQAIIMHGITLQDMAFLQPVSARYA